MKCQYRLKNGKKCRRVSESLSKLCWQHQSPKYKQRGGNQELSQILEQSSTVVLADGVMYPNNAGSMIRNGAILGMNAIFFAPLDSDRYEEVSVKNPNISVFFRQNQGSLEYTRRFKDDAKYYSMRHDVELIVNYEESVENILIQALNHNYQIFVLEDYLNANIYNTDLSASKVMLIVGNENQGTGKIVKRFYDEGKIKPLYIPSCINKQSINVSYATIIGIYERNRQNRCNAGAPSP